MITTTTTSKFSSCADELHTIPIPLRSRAGGDNSNNNSSSMARIPNKIWQIFLGHVPQKLRESEDQPQQQQQQQL